tara:strand:- start:711 stop:1028 length:318 start_codon:yes stop_codon:yes gene_type:complete
MDRDNLSLNQIYGPGLGNKSGIFAWPIAACSGKVENQRFVSLSSEEAKKVLSRYNSAKRNLKNNRRIKEFYQTQNLFPGNLGIIILIFLSSLFAIYVTYQNENLY